MNTVTQSETLALSAVAAAAAVSSAAMTGDSVTVPEVAPYELHMIPLSRLRPSSRNVRQSGGTAIPELAASIARVGLLQNLTVITSPDEQWFEVVAGRRRLTAMEAGQLAAGARAAGLSRGAYLAGLVAHVPVLTGGASRVEHIAVLSESTAELATLNRNLYQLITLLRRGEDETGRPLRLLLDTLARNVRQHLDLASIALADLQPRRAATSEPRGRTRPGNRRSQA